MKNNMRLIGHFDNYEKAQVAADNAVNNTDVEVTESEGLSDDIPKRRLRKRRTANSLWAAGVPRQEISESGQSSSSVDLGPLVISGDEQVLSHPEDFCSGAASQLPENIFMYSGSQDFPRNQPLLLNVEDEVDFSNQQEQPVITELGSANQFLEVISKIDSLTLQFQKFQEVFAKEIIKL
ncbi:unnamed protein product [Allacma fusca]|uniref:Uncharacterized protein n=1 Tax=Allacma fusca TaxID=39272 RepID=A0A8J2NS26_9HEXA|nr:unnamed protein product [Allacma fusca]